MDNRKMIYLDDAIDAIKAMPDCPNGFSNTYDKAWIISVLEEVPGKATGWIPVSKRPPEDLQEVAVTWINRVYAPIKDIPQTGCAVYYDGCWYWSSPTCIEILEEHGKNYVDQIYDGIEISAWQPLPEPYRGKK